MILHERDLTDEDWEYLDSIGVVRYPEGKNTYDSEEVTDA